MFSRVTSQPCMVSQQNQREGHLYNFMTRIHLENWTLITIITSHMVGNALENLSLLFP